jgi:hypothetical protein
MVRESGGVGVMASLLFLLVERVRPPLIGKVRPLGHVEKHHPTAICRKKGRGWWKRDGRGTARRKGLRATPLPLEEEESGHESQKKEAVSSAVERDTSASCRGKGGLASRWER